MRAAAELWREAFEGEVLGEALFARLATLVPDRDQRAKVEVLRRLEGATCDLLRPVLQRHGVSLDGEAEAAAQGAAFADAAAAQPWAQLVASLGPATASYAALYAELSEVVSSPEDRSVVDALVAHELALRAFGEREAAGDADPVAPILALPHVAAWS